MKKIAAAIVTLEAELVRASCDTLEVCFHVGDGTHLRMYNGERHVAPLWPDPECDSRPSAHVKLFAGKETP